MPEFETNLLRVIAAELYVLAGMGAAREMFGKSYFSLGLGEKIAVDNAVQGLVASNYQSATPETLKDQNAPKPVGFQPPQAPVEKKS